MISVVLRKSDLRGQLLLGMAIVLACTTIRGNPAGAQVAEGSPRWKGFPVAASVLVAPFNRVQRDLAFLQDGADPAAPRTARDLLDELAKAIDATRPAGMAVLVDKTFVPIIFVPIKDAEPLLGFLHDRFGWRFHRGDDGLLRGDDLRLVARVSGSWMYFTGSDHRDHLTNLPEDPSAIGSWSDPGNLVQMNVMVSGMPIEQRAAFATLVRESLPAASTAITAAGLEDLLNESEAWQTELQYFRPLNQFHLTSRIIPVAESDLERRLASAARRPMLMEHLATTDAVAVATVSAVLDGERLNLWKNVWAGIDAAARPQLPSPRSKDVAERRMATFGTTVLDTVKAAVATGTIDVGMALHKQGDELVLLAGSSLVGARKIDQAASNLFDALLGVPAFQALQWATGANGDVTVHEFQLPTDDNTRGLFGEAMHVAAGFGPDRVYAAIGGPSAMEKLSLAVDRSREDAPSQGALAHMSLRVAPLMALLDRAPGSDTATNASVREIAEIIARHRKNDVVEFDLNVVDRALEARVRVDSGVVRTVLAAAGDVAPPDRPGTGPSSPPATAGTDLALRVRPGDRFQLQFDTDSDVKTRLANGDRIERATYSSIYEFRVLEARPDGAVRVEAVLKRATIAKKSPDGDWAFDSAAKNPPGSMNPEMVLYMCMVDEPFQMTVAADGTLDDFGGLAEAVDRMVDTKLVPPADERPQAKAFVEGSFNPGGLRDTLGRAFEFYPGKATATGDRWTRTCANVSGIVFDLNNKFLLKSRTEKEAVISVRGQVVEKGADPSAPIHWEVMGTQTGTVTLDPSDGRLLHADYTLKLDAEATVEQDGKPVVTPVESTISMRIAPPVPAKKGSFSPRKRD